jgi:hypothetical protein
VPLRVGASIVRVCTTCVSIRGVDVDIRGLRCTKLLSAQECQSCRHITAIRVLFPGMGRAGVRAYTYIVLYVSTADRRKTGLNNALLSLGRMGI